MTVFNETSPLDPPPAVPTRYILCSQDRAISRDWAIRTAREQFDATIEEFDASHSPFWSRPADFVELLAGSDMLTTSASAAARGSEMSSPTSIVVKGRRTRVRIDGVDTPPADIVAARYRPQPGRLGTTALPTGRPPNDCSGHPWLRILSSSVRPYLAAGVCASRRRHS